MGNTVTKAIPTTVRTTMERVKEKTMAVHPSSSPSTVLTSKGTTMVTTKTVSGSSTMNNGLGSGFSSVGSESTGTSSSSSPRSILHTPVTSDISSSSSSNLNLTKSPVIEPLDMDSLIKKAKRQQKKGSPQLFTYGDTAPLVGGNNGNNNNNEESSSAPVTENLTVPLDSAAAEIQGKTAAEEGVRSETVAVRRIMSSGPAVPNADQLHEKNITTVKNVENFDGSIQSRPDTDSIGARNFQIWYTMQNNPAILDTPQALAASSTAVAAIRSLQITGGIKLLPASSSSSPTTRSTESTSDSSSTAVVVPTGKNPLTVSTSLVTLTAEQIGSFIPVTSSLDTMLLQHEPTVPLVDDKGKALIVWPPRPPASSPYDQLLLYSPDDEFMLERGELFDLFARYRANPTYWTIERLAEVYNTKPEWIKVILQFISPPMYVDVEGEVYGVVDIRSTEDYEQKAVANADASSVQKGSVR